MDYDPDDLLKTADLDDLNEWLEAITEAVEDGEYEPTPWEEDFLESMAEKLEAFVADTEAEDQPLTGPQLVSLRGIFDKAK